MFKTATTVQFRETVRECAARSNITIWDSYTNGSALLNPDHKHRCVGFHVPAATEAFALIVEKKLNTMGLTAKTRLTGSHTNYIRGTCVLAK